MTLLAFIPETFHDFYKILKLKKKNKYVIILIDYFQI